ncbi:hypothetical protein ACVWZK_001263 [Bradyrhizobium sp. GM0.4]
MKPMVPGMGIGAFAAMVDDGLGAAAAAALGIGLDAGLGAVTATAGALVVSSLVK